MEQTNSLTLDLQSPSQTEALAHTLAPLVVAGDVIALRGPVGAGKSHFCRALIHQLMAAHGGLEDVPSPTFTLVQTYAFPDFDVWHCDLYRLTSPQDVFELGLDEAFDAAVCLIEWPERLGAFLPQDALDVHLTPTQSGDARQAVMAWSHPRWSARLKTLLGTTGTHD